MGSLERGNLADLVVIDGDVLGDTRQSDRVSLVIVNGRVYEAETMNEVRATPKPRRPFWFELTPGGYDPSSAAALPRFCVE